MPVLSDIRATKSPRPGGPTFSYHTMATLRTPPLRGSLLRPTGKLPKKKRPSKKTRVARATTAKDRAEFAIAAIREAKASSDADYYAIGKALIKLRRPAIWKLYATTTFREFLDDHVMPHNTADRLIATASFSQCLQRWSARDPAGPRRSSRARRTRPKEPARPLVPVHSDRRPRPGRTTTASK